VSHLLPLNFLGDYFLLLKMTMNYLIW